MVYCINFIYKSVYLYISNRNNCCKQNASLKSVYRVLWDLSYSFTIPIAYLTMSTIQINSLTWSQNSDQNIYYYQIILPHLLILCHDLNHKWKQSISLPR